MKVKQLNQDDALYHQALNLRYQLFFEEHALDKTVLFDKYEDYSDHLCIADNMLQAYGRLSEMSVGNYQISQMVVSPDLQGQGLGSEILQQLVNLALTKKARLIFLNARLSALTFYQKHHFIAVGSVFKSKSTGIEHIKMVYTRIPEPSTC